MAGLTRNVPNKPVSVPFRPPGTIKPRSAAGMKRKLETIPSSGVAGGKRPRPAERDSGSGPATFLDPFQPRAFEPDMSIAESEALTRRMQERRRYPSEEQAEDEDDLDNNPDEYIDPVLLEEEHQSASSKRDDHTPFEEDEAEAEHSSLPPSSPLAAPRRIPQARAPVLKPASGRTGAVPFRPSSVTPLPESTPRTSSITPASSVFEPVGHRLALQASNPRSGQAGAGGIRAPTTLPSR